MIMKKILKLTQKNPNTGNKNPKKLHKKPKNSKKKQGKK
jgi:hypothetical protein